MIDVDEIDRMWRDGLESAAGADAPIDDPRPRVARRVRHNRRVRTVANTSVAVVIIGAFVAGIGVFVDRPAARHTPVAGTTQTTVMQQPTVVDVTDAPGGTLSITFPSAPNTGGPAADHGAGRPGALRDRHRERRARARPRRRARLRTDQRRRTGDLHARRRSRTRALRLAVRDHGHAAAGEQAVVIVR